MSEMYDLNQPWLVMIYRKETGRRTNIDLVQFPDEKSAILYAKDCADSGMYAEILRSYERFDPS